MALATEHHKLVRECPGGVLQCIQAQWMAALLQHTTASLQHLSVCPVCVFVISRQQQQLVFIVSELLAATTLLIPTTMASTSVIMAAPSPILNSTGYYRPSLHQRPPMCNFSDDFLHICVFASTLYFICMIMISWQKQHRHITASRNLPCSDRYLLCMCHLRDISMSNVMQWLMLRSSTCVLNM